MKIGVTLRRSEAAGTWSWPPTSICCRGQEYVELYLHSRKRFLLVLIEPQWQVPLSSFPTWLNTCSWCTRIRLLTPWTCHLEVDISGAGEVILETQSLIEFAWARDWTVMWPNWSEPKPWHPDIHFNTIFTSKSNSVLLVSTVQGILLKYRSFLFSRTCYRCRPYQGFGFDGTGEGWRGIFHKH